MGAYSVEAVDVGLVVLFVVKSHDLLRDVRLKRIVCVGQVGELCERISS